MEYIWFMVSAILVILAGNRLSAHGDSLAAHTKLGHGLVGGILIASVTSLPELASSISAAMIGAPDIAFGNVYGSNAFNLMILAIVDLFQGKGSLLQIVRDSHILTAMFGILLTGISMLAIWITPYEVFNITIGWVSGYSILIMLLYLFSAFLMVRYEEKTRVRLPEEPKIETEKDQDLELPDFTSDKHQAVQGKNAFKKAVKGFIFSGIVIVAAGILLSVNADVIARNTGLGQTFVGTLLVAGATSLPELVAAIAAIRIGAYDMAVGNVLGSNIFNILILVVTDMAYMSGSVYQVVSMQHILTAGTAMILSSIAVIGLFYRSKRTILTLGWDTVAILIGYVTMMFALFKISVK
ncbi:sodium:calcium antiporter [Anoxynatronum buryatiense]|uniref:Cation:H+ antiporter n=1 Tax=Anoxynatronum buryatiense TaxID=489973 RepID=A0AA45WSJ7_9CLOT|nr:sodium:calcium antiporter [Anoxynatronum buryatiense]SMP37990.1 cation:H+ antiporter [Anoxynatronum buryatiense]